MRFFCLTILATRPAPIVHLGLMAPLIFMSSIHHEAHHSPLHSPVTSPLLGQNIFLNTCFRTLPAYVPPSVWETKFHTRTRGKIIILYILTFIFLDATLEDKVREVTWNINGRYSGFHVGYTELQIKYTIIQYSISAFHYLMNVEALLNPNIYNIGVENL